MRIYLVRHGESLGNVDSTVYKTTADHSIPLSPRGELQAQRAGAFLKTELERTQSPAKVRLWTSPYRRARETSNHIMNACEGLIGDKREDILLVEQSFGLADGMTDFKEFRANYPAEASHYDLMAKFEGRFFARFPLGESRFDVALRTRMFFGTIQRDLEKHGIDTAIIVCHGVTLRAFIMSWLHYPYEWLEKEPNPRNCAIRLICGHCDTGYVFEPYVD